MTIGFDIDILRLTYDGTRVRIGSGTIQDRDRLAVLLGTYNIPVISDSRMGTRARKYIRRGFTITNIDSVSTAVGRRYLFSCEE